MPANRDPHGPEREERVAIIGSGPGGLSAAYQLARQGILSTIFEALPKAGGMLRVGIPDHRLPPEVLDREIESSPTWAWNQNQYPAGRRPDRGQICSTRDSRRSTWPWAPTKASPWACPANRPRACARASISAGSQPDRQNPGGQNVAIVGGGNVAIDVARSAVRLGAETSRSSTAGPVRKCRPGKRKSRPPRPKASR
jgi:NADPH-dependent glutamate synthase beta subunit-like oxidoreductase